MKAAWAPLLGALALLAGGCIHDSDDKPSSVTVVLFDISKSTGSSQTRKRFEAGFALVERFLSEQGGIVAVDVIDANPLAHSNPERAVVPTKGFNTNELQHKKAVERALDPVSAQARRIIAGTRTAAGTAILDSFRLGERIFAAHADAETKYLVLFSDMVEESDRMRFTSAALAPKSVQSFIEKEREARRLPDLAGVTVYVAGAGPTTGNETKPEKIRAIEDFWRAYIEATGATLSLAHYNAELLQFP
jgi:hypothetical protein